VRLSLEVSGVWGRLRDADPKLSYSTVAPSSSPASATRYEFFDASAAAAGAAPPALKMSRVDLRLGQQLGAHVQLASAVALFADGTIDYDGQWRVRAGIAIGQPLTRNMR
jgi:hypothetical protein